MSPDPDILTRFRVLDEQSDDTLVGTVKIRGKYRVQKQRDGSWLKLGTAKPGEAELPSKRSSLKLPSSRKRSPAVKEIQILVGKKWVDRAPDMPESTMDEMFKSDKDKDKDKDKEAAAAQAQDPTVQGPEQGEADDGMGQDQEPEQEPDEPKEPEPKPQRKALHERIFRTFLNSVDETPYDRMPVAVLVLGGPLAGKTAIVKNLTREARFVRVDPEAIGTMIPEYEEAIKKVARNAPEIVKEEAGYIARKLMEKAVEDRKSLAVDATGLDQNACEEFLNSLEDLDYYRVVLLADLDRSDAVERNKFRGARTGHWAPREAFLLPKISAATFDFLKSEESADDFIRLDVRGKAPKQMSEVMEQLQALFEEPEDEGAPETPAFSLKKIKSLAVEGIRREKAKVETLPKRFESDEGPILAHYEDLHIVKLVLKDQDEDDKDDNNGEDEPPL